MKQFVTTLVTLVAGLFLFSSSTQAQSIYNGACLGNNSSHDNHFTCKRVMTIENPDGYWEVQGNELCGDGYEIDTSLCSGSYLDDGKQHCSLDNCCIPCREIQTPEETIPWGESCPQPNKRCENGTTCTGGRCLKPNSIEPGSGEECKANLECKVNPGINEHPSCFTDTGASFPTCQYGALSDRCSTDQECIDEAIAAGVDPDEAKDNVFCDPVDNFCRSTVFVPPPKDDSEPIEYDLCNQVPADKRDLCSRCQNDLLGVWTAVGCISRTPGGIVTELVSIGISIAGGIALLMILVAAFKFTISKGDPKNVGEAKELLQSAIIGLLFIVFSVTILEFIGADIFQIPGFGNS